MDLLKMLLEAKNGDLVKQVGEKLGMDPREAGSAVSALLPSLAKGMKGNLSKPGGLEGLLGAIQSGNHGRYVENPEELTNEQSINDGKNILGHILGSKDASRQAAAQAAQKTGIDVEKLKSMLPMIATMMMGGINKTAQSAGLGQQPGAPSMSGVLDKLGGSGAFGSILGKMLDIDEPEQGQAAPAKRGGLMGMVGSLLRKRR